MTQGERFTGDSVLHNGSTYGFFNSSSFKASIDKKEILLN